MKCTVIRRFECLFIIALLAISASATNLSQVSGSYEVINKTERGGQARINLRIHFTNRGSRSLSIRRLMLRDSASARVGASQACSLLVPAHGSATVTQEFTVLRTEYASWVHGNRPRLVLKFRAPADPETTMVLRLDHFSNGKEN